MRILRDAWAAADPPRGLVAAIGNFDGLHRGQRAVIERAQEAARGRAAPAAVITFEPHPLAVLRPDAAPPRLLTPVQKEELLAAMGVDWQLVVPITREFSRVSAEEFARDFLWRRLAVVEVFVGSRFAFGRDRAGTVELLGRLGSEAGFRTVGVPELTAGGEPISSTRIRGAVAAGEVATAAALLGRPFAVRGTVARGEGRGRRLGWPTMNLTPANELLPGSGVYVSEVDLSGRGVRLGAVTNVGRRPTFHTVGPMVVEAHLFDFSDEIYGEAAEIRFLARLRGERSFAGPEELAAQIRRDAAAAREYLAAGRR